MVADHVPPRGGGEDAVAGATFESALDLHPYGRGHFAGSQRGPLNRTPACTRRPSIRIGWVRAAAGPIANRSRVRSVALTAQGLQRRAGALPRKVHRSAGPAADRPHNSVRVAGGALAKPRRNRNCARVWPCGSRGVVQTVGSKCLRG